LCPRHRQNPLRSPLTPGDAEDQFDDIGCACHRAVRDHKQQERDPQAIIPPVDVKDRQHDQISEQKRDNAAKTDTAIP